MEGLKVLSLFDGISCGQVALKRAGVPVSEYYASEVEASAIKITQKNWPNTTQLGSVTDINYANGTIYTGIDCFPVGKIDLLMGGSPCQNFSMSGTRKGMVTKNNEEVKSLDRYMELKQEGFTFHGQSYLFWEFVRLLKEVKPRYFLLENVPMAKRWEAVITEAIGVEPITINAALVSAQRRIRLFWTNIPGVTQPKDRGIYLEDIVDFSVPFSRPYTPRGKAKVADSDCIMAGTADDIKGHDIIRRVYSTEGKSPTLTAICGGNQELKMAKPIRSANIVGRRLNARGVREDENTDLPLCQCLQVKNVSKSGCLTTVDKDVLFSLEDPGRYPDVYNRNDLLWRKATPLEYERLQTLDEGYTEGISNSARLRAIGNGWSVETVAHIFTHLPI